MSNKAMLRRILTLPLHRSFFLFGARNTGKSTLIRQIFTTEFVLSINLLNPDEEERFSTDPSDLQRIVDALPDNITHVVIDEIQKIPKLLDVVHNLIENTKKIFVMTGSSARKLKHGGANLLAGRAFVYNLYPFTFTELGERFELHRSLRYGMLPRAALSETDEEAQQFLRAYAQTYLKEEIWSEQFIRNLDPFRRFLEVSAQCNGKIINYGNIARDVGVDSKTIKNYFSILEDTLLGFFLEPFHHSFRKRLSQKPKFYYFDLGVCNALSKTLTLEIKPRTSFYGEQFEHFIILECLKMASYYYPDYSFSYLRTKDDAEIDLIVERPGLPILMIEIKSSDMIQTEDISSFIQITNDFGECEAICLSQDKFQKQIKHVKVFPWEKGILKYFTKEKV